MSPCPSPPPPSSAHDSASVRPAPLPQHPIENIQSTAPNGLHLITALPTSAPASSLSTPVTTSAASNPTQDLSPPQESVRSSPSQPLSVPSSPHVPASLVAVSDSEPMASSSSSPSPTSMPTRTRKTSTFRHVPSRSTPTPVIPSPLSPGGYSRTASLTSRHLDPNRPSRPLSHLSTVTLLSNPSQVEPSQGVPVGRATASTQLQNDASQPDRHTATEVADGLPYAGPPISMHRTSSSSSSPSHTHAASSPITSPSPSSTRTSTPVRSSAPYRPGFQPRGVYRPVTDEFLELRRSRRDVARIEQTRLERRLEKLINLHFGDDINQRASPPPKQVKRMSSIWELDIKNTGPSGLWRGIVQSQVMSGSKADIRGLFCVLLRRGHFDRCHIFG